MFTGGGLSGFLPGQNSAALWNRTVDIPSAGGLQIFQPVQGSATSSSVSPGHAGEGVFRTVPQMKKVRHYLRGPGRHCLRTRAHGRRQLKTCPWCSRRRRSRSWMRRRRLTRLQWRSSMWVVGATVGPDGAAVLLVARCG